MDNIKRVVVTGATSFIGQHLVEELTKKGYKVYAVVRPSSPKRHIFDHNMYVDVLIEDIKAICNLTKKINKADYFIHLGWDGIGASGRSNHAIQEENINNTLSCLQFAKEIECSKFFFAGSQAEYGSQNGTIYETAECNPLIEYGKAKLEVWKKASELSEALGLTYYHGRIFSVYGENDHPWTLVSNCIKTLCDNDTISLSTCEQLWNFLYVKDAVKIIIELLNSDAPSDVYNIASKTTKPLKDFVFDIYNSCNKTGMLSFGTRVATEPPVSICPSTEKIHQYIGDFEESDFCCNIINMIKKYKSSGEI